VKRIVFIYIKYIRMEITELYCLDQKLGIQFHYHSTKNTINYAQPLQLNIIVVARGGEKGLKKARKIMHLCCK
jgi:hypothetical protein